LSTPLIQLALHAQEPGLVGLMIRVHGSFLRLRSPIGSLLAFAMWPAFPTSDYYASSVPLTPHPRSPRIARVRHGRGITGSHVPIPNLQVLRWRALPLMAPDDGQGRTRRRVRTCCTLPTRTSSTARSRHCDRRCRQSALVNAEASNARFVASP
jgi:hypothetical protein